MVEVSFESVGVDLAGVEILREVSFAVADGEFVGIIGPNGSGKSTLLRCLYRALTPQRGTIRIGDREVAAVSLRENARQVAALTQTTSLDFDFTAAEVVAIGRLPHRGALSATTAEDRAICADAMRAAGVEHLRDRAFTSLSGGEAQRVLIARAFAQRPRLLVLDEPTNHLDIRHQFAVLDAARDRGVTVVAALHDLNLAAQYCDHLVVMSGGRVVADGPPPEVISAEMIGRWFGIGAHVVVHPGLGVPQVIYDTAIPVADPAPRHDSSPAGQQADDSRTP